MLARSICVAVLSIVALGAVTSSRADDDPKNAFKRRNDLSDEDLRKQLLLVPELGFDQAAAAYLYVPLQETTSGSSKKGSGGSKKGTIATAPFDYGPAACAQLAARTKKPDFNSLPWRTAIDSQLGKENAERLDVLSNKLRSYLRESVPRDDKRPDADKLRQLLESGKAIRFGGKKSSGGTAKAKPDEWRQPEAIPALLQLLQAENTPIRALLVDLLAEIEGKVASIALARRAVFDLSPKVREQAVVALKERPHADYRQILVDALRYPWPAVADHAAEAITALKVNDAVPDLVAQLKEPDPRLPFVVQVKNDKVHAVKELVRINHLSNCVLCHAPSTSKEDLVRGRMPIPGEEPPPLYYQERTGIFVRADITFLRQDFSVPQPVLNPVRWPGNQRFDYFIRTRKATPAEVKLFQAMPIDYKTDSPQRNSTLFALRELTQKNLGDRYENWTSLLKAIEKDRK